MSVEHLHKGVGRGLDGRHGGRRHAKRHAGAAHAFAGKHKALVCRLGCLVGRQGVDEVGLQKGDVVGVKVPAVVHGRTQQALAAKQFQHPRQHRQHRVCWNGGRSVPQAMRFKMGNDVGTVLQPLPLRRLHDRNNPAPDSGHGLGLKARVACHALLKGDALLAQIAAHLGGVQRTGHTVKNIRGAHGCVAPVQSIGVVNISVARFGRVFERLVDADGSLGQRGP